MSKRINTRERMDEDGEWLMQRFAVLIETHVEANDITSSLYSKFVLSHEDKLEIENEKTKTKRIRLLTSRLISHGSKNAFSAFLEALNDAHYDVVRTTLMNAESARGNPPNIVRPGAPDREKFRNEMARRKTTLSKLSFLGTKVMKIEEKIATNPKRDPVLMQGIEDIKRLLEESAETTKTVEGLARQLEEKEKKLKEAEEKIKELEEKIKKLNKEKEFDRNKISHLESKVDVLEENDRSKDEEIRDLQRSRKCHEEKLEQIENLLKKQNTKESSRSNTTPKPKAITPRNRFQKT